jgi:hypothetical protein
VRVDEHVGHEPVDAVAQHPLLELLGDLGRGADEEPVARRGPLGLRQFRHVHARPGQRLVQQLAGPVAVLVDDQRRGEAGLQRRRIPAGLGAPRPHRGHLPRQLGSGADDVEVVGVPGGEGERLLLAPATDQQRQVLPEPGLVDGTLGAEPASLDSRPRPAQHRDDDAERLLEPAETLGDGTELVAVLAVFLLMPAGADAEHGAPLADHVERGDHLGQQGGIAVADAGHHGRQLHPAGGRRQGPEQGVRLQHRAVGRPDQRRLVEVVHRRDQVEPGVLRGAHLGDQCGEEAGDRLRVMEVRDVIAETYAHALVSCQVTGSSTGPKNWPKYL